MRRRAVSLLTVESQKGVSLDAMCHRASKAPFTFLVNIIVPGNPPFHLVMSWAADASSFEGIETLSRCACISGAHVCRVCLARAMLTCTGPI